MYKYKQICITLCIFFIFLSNTIYEINILNYNLKVYTK